VIDGAAHARAPIDDLADALALGSESSARRLPAVRGGGGLRGGGADRRAPLLAVVSAVLAAPYAREDVVLDPIEGKMVSTPYVDLTLQVMRAFGADAAWIPHGSLRVAKGHPYRAREYAIEPDASAAAYPFCAAAIAGGSVRVDGVAPDSLQSDYQLLGILERMGCRVERGATSVTVRRRRRAASASKRT
jgi:3-phosphoshikimate 1-carboxyvinyltransferase